MSILESKKSSHTVTTEYKITTNDLVGLIAKDLGVPTKSIELKTDIDIGRDNDGNYEYAPRITQMTVKVTNP